MRTVLVRKHGMIAVYKYTVYVISRFMLETVHVHKQRMDVSCACM